MTVKEPEDSGIVWETTKFYKKKNNFQKKIFLFRLEFINNFF